MSDKKQQLIDTALTLFYRHGIHAMGINEILKQSGIAKKTLYHHFATKDDLILAAIACRDERFMTWFRSLLDSNKSGQEQILDVFYGMDDWVNDRVERLGHFMGCFFVNASAEYGEMTHPVYQACQAHKQNVADTLAEVVNQFESDEAKAGALVDALCLLKEGIITTAKVQNRRDAAETAIPMVKVLLGIESEKAPD